MTCLPSFGRTSLALPHPPDSINADAASMGGAEEGLAEARGALQLLSGSVAFSARARLPGLLAVLLGFVVGSFPWHRHNLSHCLDHRHCRRKKKAPPSAEHGRGA